MKKKGVYALDTEIGKRLLFLMDRMDMKQVELADKIGISKQSLYKYLHCKCEPRSQIIARMATVLNTSADYIVGLTNDVNPVLRDTASESAACEYNELMQKIMKLSYEDRIRIEERLDFLLEKSK